MGSNIVSSLGAGSGIDTSALVSSLVEVTKAPQEQRLDQKKETLDAQISAYGTLKSSLSELQNALSPLGNNDTFNARSVAFPETTVITPDSLDADAQTGSYQIEVTQIAQAQSLATSSVSDPDADMNKSGNLTIKFGTWTYDGSDSPQNFALNDSKSALNIAVESGDTLNDLAKKINDEDSGIQATVLKVGSNYQLMLTAPSGEANALEITSDDASLSEFEFSASNYASVTETQQGQDSKLKVNGLEITRESNDIDDVIDGFNFTLNKASIGENVNFSIQNDKNVSEQAVRDFVEAYNTFFETANNLTGFTRDEENKVVRGSLATDSSAKLVISRVRDMLTGAVPGLSNDLSSLTNIGIRTQLDGSLEIDEDDFSAAFKDSYDQIEALFATQVNSTNSNVSVEVGSYAQDTVAGTYSATVSADPTKGVISASAITATGFASGSDDFTPSLDTSVGDYSFKVSIDGTESETITLTGTYNTAEDIRSELQTLINGDSSLKKSGAAVDVAYDNATDSFSFTSRTYGTTSEVRFTEAGADIGGLGINTGLTGTSGSDAAGTINSKTAFGSGQVLLPELDSDPYGFEPNCEGRCCSSR